MCRVLAYVSIFAGDDVSYQGRRPFFALEFAGVFVIDYNVRHGQV